MQTHPSSPFDIPAPPPPGFDREAAQRDTLAHAENLIRLDTQNPPGNEMLAVLYFESIFRAVPGIETHVLDVEENRGNFVARLRAARPSGRPVIVVGHTDVVGADPDRWDSPPFEPTIRDGYLYGRGAIDDKGMLAAAATAVLQLAPQRDRLQRDLIFLATAAEEGGPPIGIDRVVEQHQELIGDAEFAINEGGRVRLRDGRIQVVNIQTTEKVPYNVIATARGPGGHASVPLPHNALAALARAAARVHEWRPPVRLYETTRLYFARLAEIEENSEMRRAMQQVSSAAQPAAIQEAAEVLARDPLHNAALRTGASLTLLGGGLRANVIPSEGTATFNVRVLPGEDIEEVVREMNRVGGEENVVFEYRGVPKQDPPPSPIGTALFRAMEETARIMAPEAVILPFMSTGATDGAVLRAHGIPTYGILPFPLLMEDELRMHAENERVPVPALGWAAEYLYRVLATTST